MKIVIDRAIPFVQGVFEPYAEVLYREGAQICREDLSGADALITRTRTQCNEELLGGTGVKMIATATIGTDHIDQKFCAQNGIFWSNAAGCNSGGVMNYVLSALFGSASRKRTSLQGATFGIIGAGHAGSRVEAAARILGFKLLLCDPPKARDDSSGRYCTQDELLAESDIVSLHVPLSESTRGMANADFFARMRYGAFFINTSHGELVDEEALIEARPKLGHIIIDTWSGEPAINRKLLSVSDIATPHIAGYSYQGKQNATMLAVRSVARFFGISGLYEFFPATDIRELESVKLELRGKDQGRITAAMQYNYPVFTDDFMFRINPAAFSELRDNYSYRREFYID